MHPQQPLHERPFRIPSRGAAVVRGFGIGLLLAAFCGCSDWTLAFSGIAARCAEGLVAVGPRCCAEGQTVVAGQCSGTPRNCPVGWRVTSGINSGCERLSQPSYVDAGAFRVGPNDWESEHVIAREGTVGAFWLDATEVTWAKWQRCVDAGACAARTSTPEQSKEPGLPVVEIAPGDAQRFCSWSLGRLPRVDEWLRVAAGPSSRRFPWGQTGLVCRRASFGLVRGPCARDGNSADWAGARPDGRSEIGLYDLVGNVAEFVESAPGKFEVYGGSFRSDHAAELKSWSSVPYVGPAADVGFRCAYDADPSTTRR